MAAVAVDRLRMVSERKRAAALKLRELSSLRPGGVRQQGACLTQYFLATLKDRYLAYVKLIEYSFSWVGYQATPHAIPPA